MVRTFPNPNPIPSSQFIVGDVPAGLYFTQSFQNLCSVNNFLGGVGQNHRRHLVFDIVMVFCNNQTVLIEAFDIGFIYFWWLNIVCEKWDDGTIFLIKKSFSVVRMMIWYFIQILQHALFFNTKCDNILIMLKTWLKSHI